MNFHTLLKGAVAALALSTGAAQAQTEDTATELHSSLSESIHALYEEAAETLDDETIDSYCWYVGTRAERVIYFRFGNSSLSVMMDILDDKQDYGFVDDRGLILAAYDVPVAMTELEHRAAKVEFQSQIELDCYRHFEQLALD